MEWLSLLFSMSSWALAKDLFGIRIAEIDRYMAHFPANLHLLCVSLLYLHHCGEKWKCRGGIFMKGWPFSLPFPFFIGFSWSCGGKWKRMV
jgi:hypothetical protein